MPPLGRRFAPPYGMPRYGLLEGFDRTEPAPIAEVSQTDASTGPSVSNGISPLRWLAGQVGLLDVLGRPDQPRDPSAPMDRHHRMGAPGRSNNSQLAQDDHPPPANDNDFCRGWLQDLQLLYLIILDHQRMGVDVEFMARQYEEMAEKFCRTCPHLCAQLPRFTFQ